MIYSTDYMVIHQLAEEYEKSGDYPGYTFSELLHEAEEANNELYYKIISGLPKEPEKILIIADLGLWDGRRSAYREINSYRAIFSTYYDGDATWDEDNLGLLCENSHHDGTNYYRYYTYKKTARNSDILDLKEAIFNNEDCEELKKKVLKPVKLLKILNYDI